MDTVIDDVSGEEIKVQPVEAVASVASVNALSREFPAGAGKRIEQAMAAAAASAQSEGVTDPLVLRDRMRRAREGVKAAMRIEMNDLRSQADAAAREKERERDK